MVGKFGSKNFTVSRQKIYTFDGFTWSSKLETDKQNATGKKPTTAIKGAGLNSIKITLLLHRELGVHPRKEIEDWEKIKDAAVPNAFILGANPMGLNKYLVTDCSASKTVIDGNGDINSAELSLTFEEYLPAGKQVKSVAAGAKGNTRAAGLTVQNAYSVVTPTPQEKSQLKRKNAGM